jgi:hypothetical protein
MCPNSSGAASSTLRWLGVGLRYPLLQIKITDSSFSVARCLSESDATDPSCADLIAAAGRFEAKRSVATLRQLSAVVLTAFLRDLRFVAALWECALAEGWGGGITDAVKSVMLANSNLVLPAWLKDTRGLFVSDEPH